MNMQELRADETELIGQWLVENARVRGDATVERIRWLTTARLRKLGVSPTTGAWETLYQDPSDSRFWELIYPHSEMQGGGPPSLRQLSREEAFSKYQDIVP